MQAVILAGGAGTRLMPLTKDLPKPLMPVMNNPVIDYSLRLLHKAGVDGIYITLRHGADKIIEFLNARYPVNNFRYEVEERPLGTFGCIAALKDKLKAPFFVLSADALTDIDLTDMARAHAGRGADISMACKRAYNPGLYGEASVSGGFVSGFKEKPPESADAEGLVNCGVYIFESEVFGFLPDKTPSDIAKDLIPAILGSNGKIAAYEHKNYWRDIGDVNRFYRANFDALRHRVDFKAFKGGFDGINAATVSEFSGEVERCLIGKNTEFAHTVSVYPNNIIGRNVTAEPHTVISNSVVFADTHISASAINSVVGDGFGVPVIDGGTRLKNVFSPDGDAMMF